MRRHMTGASTANARSLWRKFTAAYAEFLSWLLVFTVAILIIPVTLQIFSRYTE